MWPIKATIRKLHTWYSFLDSILSIFEELFVFAAQVSGSVELGVRQTV